MTPEESALWGDMRATLAATPSPEAWDNLLTAACLLGPPAHDYLRSIFRQAGPWSAETARPIRTLEHLDLAAREEGMISLFGSVWDAHPLRNELGKLPGAPDLLWCHDGGGYASLQRRQRLYLTWTAGELKVGPLTKPRPGYWDSVPDLAPHRLRATSASECLEVVVNLDRMHEWVKQTSPNHCDALWLMRRHPRLAKLLPPHLREEDPLLLSRKDPGWDFSRTGSWGLRLKGLAARSGGLLPYSLANHPPEEIVQLHPHGGLMRPTSGAPLLTRLIFVATDWDLFFSAQGLAERINIPAELSGPVVTPLSTAGDSAKLHFLRAAAVRLRQGDSPWWAVPNFPSELGPEWSLEQMTSRLAPALLTSALRLGGKHPLLTHCGEGWRWVFA